MIFLVFFWSHKSNLLKMMCFFFWFRLMIASNSLFLLENGIRASRIYRKTSTFLQFYSMFLRALRICPGNQLMVSATLVIDFIRIPLFLSILIVLKIVYFHSPNLIFLNQSIIDFLKLLFRSQYLSTRSHSSVDKKEVSWICRSMKEALNK